ncbi:pathogenesis-related protein 1 [Blyttiomyces helicus]|uniref:Pathogenesis-related protein 1 n=2 Tax=Fungi incertae sedis TaxID=112252 RepID=A0A4P9ZK18_9FUNG|nr:pathogenesis-related protein 1 [Blyttiomyces helicus]RKP33577.1 pathogenesis-related protein 1 [Dimargaris cristalligena]|eukprot:RKO93127.1 pathogenesis-related protein 1 [Blyttiomyces helicus]
MNTFKHSGGPYGENLYKIAGTAPILFNLSSAIEDWANEVQFYSPGEIFNTTNFERFGHYTQMVWPTTKSIGCCAAENGLLSNVIYACEYSPPGNVIGEAAYE